MKTTKVSILMIVGMLMSGAIGHADAAAKEYEFRCECKSTPKKCDSLENLNIKIKNGVEVIADVGSSDWEFNEQFEAKLSKESVPEKFSENYSRFTITSNREYLPSYYNTGDLLIDTAMKTGGTRIAGIAEITYVGKVIVISHAGRAQLMFACARD